MAKCGKPPIRFWIWLMIFFSTFTNYMMRANMSVSVGEMVIPSGKQINSSCPASKDTPEEKPTEPPEINEGERFNWTQNEQGQIIAAYFYGTMVTFAIGGTMAEWLGAVNVIFWTSMASVLLTAITPILTIVGGFWVTFTLRFLVGVAGGPVYPALNVLVARWAPPNEKGKFVAAFMGNTIGVVITWIVVGHTTDAWGWEAGFYSVAVLMAIYCIVFFILTTDSPQQHRWITDEEKEYIEQSQGGTVSKVKKIPPYKALFSSVRFWAAIIAQFGNLWALNLMLTFAPKYFKEALDFNLKESVVWAALPYLARLLTSQVFGSIGDWMRKNEKMSVTNIRKFFVIFSHVLPALCFGFVYVAGCVWGAVLALLVINQGLNGAVVVGHMINCQDLSPNFAGTLYGIMNFIGSTTGFFVPAINAAIFNHDDKIFAAAMIFLLGGIVLLLTATFFFIFGSGEVQPWNEGKKTEERPAAQ